MYKVFTLLAIVVISVATLGCNQRMTQDVMMDVMSNMDNSMDDIPICKVGDTLMPGQKCADQGTDAVFSVLENGLGSYTSETGLLYEATDVLDATWAILNEQTYNFKARKQMDGRWEIEIISHEKKQ